MAAIAPSSPLRASSDTTSLQNGADSVSTTPPAKEPDETAHGLANRQTGTEDETGNTSDCDKAPQQSNEAEVHEEEEGTEAFDHIRSASGNGASESSVTPLDGEPTREVSDGGTVDTSNAQWRKPEVPQEILLAMVQDAGVLPSPGTVSHPQPSKCEEEGVQVDSESDCAVGGEDGEDEIGVKMARSPIFAMARPNKGEIKRQPILRAYTEDQNLKVLEGWCWLTKISGSNVSLRGSKTPEWRRRYCMLERGTIYYHKLKMRDSFTLQEPVVSYEQLAPQSITGTRLGYVFDLTFVVGNKKDRSTSIRFAAGSVAELEDWERAFTRTPAAESEEQEEETAARVAKNHKHGLLMMYDGGKWRLRDLTLHYHDIHAAGEVKEGNSVVLEIASREKQSVFPLLRSFVEKSELKLKQPNLKDAMEKRAISIANDKEVLLLSPEGGENVSEDWLAQIDRELMFLHDAEDENDASESEGKRLKQPSLQTLQHGNDIYDLVKNGKAARDKARLQWNERSPPIPQVLTGDQKPFVILSIDGGGLKGVMDCVLLQRLEEKYPDLLDHVDMFAGTSNGSIISTGFAFGYSPATARTLMEMKGPLIFTNPASKLKGMSQPRFDVTTPSLL